MAISRRQGVVIAILVALPLIGLAVIALQPKHALGALGATCTSDMFCDSSICLHHGSADRFGNVPPNSPGICTVECTDDRGCPAAMRCGTVARQYPFGGAEQERGLEPAVRCIPREWAE